jgi:flagellar hook-associated protein 3 FlgL
MRVSTSQFYFQNSQQLSSLQSDVNDQVKYLSSGKRVLTAKDDAVSYGTLSGYKEAQQNIKNIGVILTKQRAIIVYKK